MAKLKAQTNGIIDKYFFLIIYALLVSVSLKGPIAQLAEQRLIMEVPGRIQVFTIVLFSSLPTFIIAVIKEVLEKYTLAL